MLGCIIANNTVRNAILSEAENAMTGCVIFRFALTGQQAANANGNFVLALSPSNSDVATCTVGR